MIRVLADLLFFTGTKGGMESYVRQLYSALPADGFEYTALASRELAALDTSWFPGRVVDSGISGDNRASWARGELTAVSSAAARQRADVVHSPANIGPWAGRTPVVLTVHDLLPFTRPDFVPGRYGGALRTLVRLSARNARRVLTISETTARDLRSVLHIDESKIDVIPLAGHAVPPIHPLPRRADLLLALGNRLPHKNFEGLLYGLALITPHERPKLVILGGSEPDPLAAVVDRLGLAEWVRLEGWLGSEEVDALYATATALIVPTLFEGFGLPLLEAMARGCPVICSDLPVLREVAADAAVYFNPTDAHSIAAAIRSTFAEPQTLVRLARKGLDRAGQFSWNRTAEATALSFASVVDARRARG